MAVASPIDIAVNPANTAQRYILWGNGRIDPVGGAIPIVAQATWYDRIDQPVAVALHITNWATGAGYMLTANGSVHAFMGAPDIPGGVMEGVPYVSSGKTYVDWSWNPAANGQGYILDGYGKLWAFGGATAYTAPQMWGSPLAKKLVMQWSPTKYGLVLDARGGLHDVFTAQTVTGGASWPTADLARDVVITTWSATPAGYLLDAYGGVHEIGAAPATFGFPYRSGADVARLLFVISPTNPMQLGEVWSGGQQYQWTSSTPPTVVAGGANPVSPAATVTGTSRPLLSWTYSDPQSDSQAAWELYVHPQAFVTANAITDPTPWASFALIGQWGINRTTRGIVSPVDLPNGTYRMFVRAQDTAGQWSTWSSYGWTQNVPAPATPTGLTATANQTTFRVALSVSATTGGTAKLIRFECSDDAGTTWTPVRGASAVTLATTTTATDYDAPLGVARQYRAVAYAVDPAVASAPSATATATLTTLGYVVTATDNSTLGGRLRVQDPVEWTRSVKAGVFEGIDADYPTVVKDGGKPRARRSTLHVYTDTAAEWAVLEALVMSRSTLVYRDPQGSVRYCEVVGDWGRQLTRGAISRSMHTTDVPLVEVQPPQVS